MLRTCGHYFEAGMAMAWSSKIETPDKEGVAPLHIASTNGHLDMVRLLALLGADISTPDATGATPAYLAAQRGWPEVVRELALLGADLTTPNNDGATPVIMAAHEGHAQTIRVLAEFKVDVTTAPSAPTTYNTYTPLALSVYFAHFEAAKTLLLLGAPVTINDLKQCSDAAGNAQRLRADLQAWAADTLAQHRAFHDTFLHGCSAHQGITLYKLAGLEETRQEIAGFAGIVVGEELRRTRAMGRAIAAIDWAAHDEAWLPAPPPRASGDVDGDEEGQGQGDAAEAEAQGLLQAVVASWKRKWGLMRAERKWKIFEAVLVVMLSLFAKYPPRFVIRYFGQFCVSDECRAHVPV